AALSETLGIDVTFTSYERPSFAAPLPLGRATSLGDLDGGENDIHRVPRDGDDDPSASTSERIESLFHGRAATAPAALAAVPLTDRVYDWWSSNGPYFSSLAENSQSALVLFLTAFFIIFILWAHWRRRRLARSRDAIPLSIGGWGTRGKSGTERLKAGLFHGLGYQVLAKTTGCEAMFIHSGPGQQPMEVFIYRPYDKATIWEQAAMLDLASGVDTEVFLWECMALNPRYVEILQHDWMHDDIATLTNAYPDHEDVQGPAGSDVAEVIGRFIPKHSTLITSEVNFLPLFNHVAAQRDTVMYDVPAFRADLIPGDVLDLFPYREHPHNIALVARMAEELGIDPHLAVVTMAEHVVPDLGVLKAYGPILARGRRLTFVNGMSANERTGFLNNWRRLALGDLDADEDPAALVVTVVNNRADRISRSQVFAEMMVRDVAADRQVLIGTNLKGLRSYLENALTTFLGERLIVQDSDFDNWEPTAKPLVRLDSEMRRLRIPRATREAALRRLSLYAAAIERTLPPESDALMVSLSARLDALLGPEGDESTDPEAVTRELADDQDLIALIDRA
ncbi:MAG: hypothetical protein AAGC55_23355, partial [Myxococcota bacterium]